MSRVTVKDKQGRTQRLDAGRAFLILKGGGTLVEDDKAGVAAYEAWLERVGHPPRTRRTPTRRVKEKDDAGKES